MKWKACQFEKDTVQQLLDTQFSSYMNRVKKTDCQAELRRLLEAGPPVWLSDANGFPMDEGETHVENLWYAEDNKERSARLKVSEEGEAKRGGRIVDLMPSHQIIVRRGALLGRRGTSCWRV